MIKRAFAVLLSVAALSLSASLGLLAGQAPRTPRIAILIPESGAVESETVKALRSGLRDLGYKEGENLYVELRDLKGDRSALKSAATELVNKKVDLIFTTGTRATLAAMAATSAIPVVFYHPADPVALGFLKNRTHPQGNVTGVAAFSLQMTQRRLEIFKEVVPDLGRIHIYHDANNKFSEENFLAAEKAAAKLGLQVADHPVKTGDELKNSLDQLQPQRNDAIFHVDDNLVESYAGYLLDTAKKLKMPTMFHEEIWAVKGSLASYGPDSTEVGRQAARLVDKLLKGAKPRDLPVQQVGKFDLVINLRTANVIGLDIAPGTLGKADRVIR